MKWYKTTKKKPRDGEEVLCCYISKYEDQKWSITYHLLEYSHLQFWGFASNSYRHPEYWGYIPQYELTDKEREEENKCVERGIRKRYKNAKKVLEEAKEEVKKYEHK